MVFLVLEAHGTLYFGSGVNKRAQRITRQRVVITAGVDVLELASFVVSPLRIRSLKKEAFDLVGRVQGVAFILVKLVGIKFQDAANVGSIRRAALVNYISEHQHFARAKIIRRRPIKRGPVDSQPQIAFPLRRKSADRRSVERQVVPALDEKFLV